MTSEPAIPRTVSVVDAIGDAIAVTRKQLFPFRFKVWLTLGFVAFLDQCGRRGGGGNGGNWDLGKPGDMRFDGDTSFPRNLADSLTHSEPWIWVTTHPWLTVTLTAIGLVVVVALTALVVWLQSRGTYMYVDNVATGRAEVARPWRETAAKAHSYFAWRFGTSLVALPLVVGLVISVVWAFLAFVQGSFGGSGAGIMAVIFAFVIVGLLIAVALFSVLLRDFVAPLHWMGSGSCEAAVRTGFALVRRQPFTFVGYVLAKIVFAIVFVVVAIAACCVTCCCAILPVLSQTILQPIHYFERAWSLCLLRQMGHDPFGQAEPQPEPPPPTDREPAAEAI